MLKRSLRSKILPLLLATALTFSLLPAHTLAAGTSSGMGASARAATSGTFASLSWSLEGSALTISGTGPMPEFASDFPAPWGKEITSLTIEPGVYNIGDNAFADCGELTSVSLPDTLSFIGVAAFQECNNLQTIRIPEGVTIIDSHAFYHCVNLTEVYLPKSLTNVQDYAFCLCDNLTDVHYSGSLAQWNALASSMGEGNDELVNASIHAEETSGLIASGTCGSLTWSLTDNGELTISGEGPLSPSSPVPWASYREMIASLTIEPGVVYIGTGAFSGYTELEEVSLPNTLQTIDRAAFSECESLTSITIPEGVTDLGPYAFLSCNHLTQISLPASLTAIGTAAFSWCPSLTQINVADGNPTYVGGDRLYAPNGTFLWCPMAASGSYTVPEGVTDIGTEAFYGCSSLTEISLPASLTVVAEYAFDDCNLSSVSFAGTEDQWKAIQIGAGNDALTEGDLSFAPTPSATLTEFNVTGPHTAAMTTQSEVSGYAIAAFYTAEGQMIETRMVSLEPGTNTYDLTDLKADLTSCKWKVILLNEYFAPLGEAFS